MVAGCQGLTSAADKPVAVEIVAPPDSIQVGQTIPIHVRVLNRDGDSIPDAAVLLVSLNPDTLGIDTAAVALVGKAKGPARWLARSGDLPSTTFPVVVK